MRQYPPSLEMADAQAVLVASSLLGKAGFKLLTVSPDDWVLMRKSAFKKDRFVLIAVAKLSNPNSQTSALNPRTSQYNAIL